MFEVECPSCRAGYKVDERRIPQGGLKMRCPKCGESFEVAHPGATEPPVLGGALGLRAAAPAPPPERRSATKQTMIGVAPHHAAPAPPAKPALPEPPAPPSASGLELELSPDEQVQSSDGLEMDLPSPSPQWPTQPPPTVPTPRRAAGASVRPSLEIDLPGVPSAPTGLSDAPLPGLEGEEFDLPQLSGELPELPELPDAGLPGLAAHLPVPTFSLPAPAGPGLPTPAGAGLPKPAGAGLPAPGAQLPALGGSLPSPVFESVPPGDILSLDSLAPESGSGLVLTNAPPSRISEVPVESFGDPFGDGPTAQPESMPPIGQGSAFGETPFGAVDDEGGEFDAFPTESSGRDASGAGSGYGNVSLDDGLGSSLADSLGLGADVDRGPAPPAAAASAQVVLPGPGAVVPTVKTPKSGLSKGARIAIAGVLVLAVAGGALGAFLPEVGPYGAYKIIDMVSADRHRAELEGDVRTAQRGLDEDTLGGATAAFRALEAGRATAPRFKARTAYAAYVALLGQLRFGAADLGAQGTVLVDGLTAASTAEVPYLELARVARAAVAGSPQTALASGFAERSLAHALLTGEAAILAGNGTAALTAFEKAKASGESARVLFGLARATRLLGQNEAAQTWATATLKVNPGHVGAKLLLAEVDVLERKKDEELVTLLEPIGKGEGGASVRERAEALVLLGDLHLGRGRINDAETVFASALSLEPGSATAQRGLADALFEAGRYSEAQTRYEAALKTAPTSLQAGLGLVRCRIRLEELDSARTLLAQLETAHPESTALRFWAGQVAEQAGDRAAASTAYEKAIKLDQSGAELVGAYIGLTRILGQEGKPEAAEVTIAEAQKRFPEDPLVYEALAELSSSRGSFESAIADYDRALELDPGNLGLHFAKAIALRKAQRFEEATKAFDLVEQKSKDYPGLALERANLLEASGQGEEALALYERALQEAPDSLDMMLRVGCARAQAKQGQKALEVLRKVESDRPNSAEVNFCIGLAHLFRSGGLADARRYLQRAVQFDASRANYHLYVGWVAIDMGDYSLADASLGKAIQLDQTLADAYWKRGELRVKQGAVDDAVRDLTKALTLTPTRFEAHAQLGLAYLQNGKEPLALEEFRKATEQPGVHPYFNYRYGELLLANRKNAEAEKQLTVAVEVGGKEAPNPPWLWDAHRLLAMALGRKRAALEHWKAFADHAPTSSPYLGEALREMDAIMATLGR